MVRATDQKTKIHKIVTSDRVQNSISKISMLQIKDLRKR